MSNHIQVPLKNLRFGHEAPVHPGNARTTGREEGIAELAAHIHARGKIDDLLVYEDGVPDILFVANGNRSLAALRMIHGKDRGDILVDCKLTTAEQAYEDSLAVAVLAKKFHPVDEYEGFARLRDEKGKTEEEIAHQYGLTKREIEQVLALGGSLSPNVRNLWRNGRIKAEVARALTMAPDHKTQDDIIEAYVTRTGGIAGIEDYDVKQSLKIGNDNCGTLVEFVGIEAYVERGGRVTRDLFGTDHQVSDPKLAKTMAAEKLKEECAKLVQSGWSFAVTSDSVRNTRHDYSRLKVEAQPTPEETEALAKLNAIFDPENGVRAGRYACDSFAELTGAQQQAYLAYQGLERAIELRCYTPKMMASAGCFVGIDDDGFLKIEFGHVKPKQQAAAAKVVKEEKKEQAKAAAKTAAAEGRPAPESKHLSNALIQRLEASMISATRDAIAAEPQLVNSALFETLAKAVCAQIVPDRVFSMPDAIRTKLPTIRQALNPGVFNTAIAKRFDAEDYFSNAPKGFVLKAIAEGINPDEARKVAAKSKADVAKFALANLRAMDGWLPKELRTVHYKGPGSEGYKPPAAAVSASAKQPDRLAEPVMEAALAKAMKNLQPLKRAAAARKSVTKTSTKKTTKKKR